MARPVVLLSFDVEEFDIPTEYGREVPFVTQIRVSAEGLIRILDLLSKLKLRATFFTTAVFARERTDLVLRMVQEGHELASHSYYHNQFENAHLAESKSFLESLSGTTVNGFRRARFDRTDVQEIAKAGYTYDSSENPIFLPGRYCRCFEPRTVYRSEGILKIPISSTPLLRIPLFWLAFKNFPRWLTRMITLWVLRADRYLCIFFHPWEFSDLSSYGLPWVVSNCDGDHFLEQLKEHLQWLQPHADFITMREFALSKQSEDLK